MEFWDTVLKVCGGIAIIGSAGAVIFRWIRPAVKLSSRVKELERRSERDYALLQTMEKNCKTQSKVLLAMINHQIDGNGIAEMKRTRTELQNLIVEA